MSARVSMDTPRRPTSSSARSSSESRPIWVGRSKAQATPWLPCSKRNFQRWLVSSAVPKPEYRRMAQGRTRYMAGYTPRVKGYWPGKPILSR